MATKQQFSIMQEIAKTEETIKTTYEQIAALEKRLSQEELPEKKQKIIARELEEVRKLLKSHEEQLAHLRTHNRKTFAFVAGLMFIIFTVYMFYVLVWGNKK